MPKIDN